MHQAPLVQGKDTEKGFHPTDAEGGTVNLASKVCRKALESILIETSADCCGLHDSSNACS